MIAETVPSYIWHPESLNDTEFPVYKLKAKEASLCISWRLICLSLFQSPNSYVITQCNNIAGHNISQNNANSMQICVLTRYHQSSVTVLVFFFSICLLFSILLLFFCLVLFVFLGQEENKHLTLIHFTQALVWVKQ